MRCWRNSLYTARKLLSVKCSKCYSDIDTGDMYYSWAGLMEWQISCYSFHWHYTHYGCA